jgi:hypothetical protein
MATSWSGEDSIYRFETEVVSGSYLAAGDYQGMRDLVHRPTGVQVAAGETLPGLVAPYRVFGNGRRYDDVRDRSNRVEIVPEGLRIIYPSNEENPFDLESLYCWSGDTLDVHSTITAHEDLLRFEFCISSYLSAGFRAFVSRQSNEWGEQGGQIVPVDVNPMTDVYAMFPRDETAAGMIFDGRWDLPPYPVRWTVPAWFDLPLAYRRHAKTGVMGLAMGDPKECYTIGISVNDPPEDPDPAKGYQAIYFYLFGRDIRQHEVASARVRWVIGKELPEREIYARWETFLKDMMPPVLQ